MSIALEILPKIIDPHINTNERIELIINVTARGININDANITVTASGGRLSSSSGVTDDNGVFRTVFDDNDDGADEYTITFTASKSPFTDATRAITVTVATAPSEFTERKKELLIGVRYLRDLMLNYIKEELNDDPDLYIATGATKPPVYHNGFNYESRQFPQIIASGGTLVPRRTSIGNNIVGWVYEENDYKFKATGGIHDVTINFSTLAQDKHTQENLLDKVTMAIWGKKFLSFLAADVWILSINAGGENTEPWGAKLLYGGSVNVSTATQWHLKEQYKEDIGSITYDMSVA